MLLEINKSEVTDLHDGTYHNPKNVVSRLSDLDKELKDQILYMQINKVATRSIFDAIWNKPIIVPDHALLGPILLSDIKDIPLKFIFAFVRNPYDRVVSSWKYSVMKNLFRKVYQYDRKL